MKKQEPDKRRIRIESEGNTFTFNKRIVAKVLRSIYNQISCIHEGKKSITTQKQSKTTDSAITVAGWIKLYNNGIFCSSWIEYIKNF